MSPATCSGSPPPGCGDARRRCSPSCPCRWPDRSPGAPRSVARGLEGDDVDVEPVEQRQRALVTARRHLHALRRRLAPARVHPDLGLVAQPGDLAVERVDVELRAQLGALVMTGDVMERAPRAGRRGTLRRRPRCSSWLRLVKRSRRAARGGSHNAGLSTTTSQELAAAGAELHRPVGHAAAPRFQTRAYSSPPRPTGPRTKKGRRASITSWRMSPAASPSATSRAGAGEPGSSRPSMRSAR